MNAALSAIAVAGCVLLILIVAFAVGAAVLGITWLLGVE